jgi:hypothetical protein
LSQGGHLPSRVRSIAVLEIFFDTGLLAGPKGAGLGGASCRALLERGREIDLQVGGGRDPRADVAPFDNDVAPPSATPSVIGAAFPERPDTRR